MGAILLDEQTAPGTPSTGQVVLYPKSDGFLYSKDDAGTETQLATTSVASATTDTEGIVELATQAEVDAGTAGKVPTTDLQKVSLDTAQATTSGTSKTFTPPAGTRKITIGLNQVSTNSTSALVVRLGDSGGIETSGYVGAVAQMSGAPAITISAYSANFNICNTMSAAVNVSGKVELVLMDSATNKWAESHVMGRSDGAVVWTGGGTKALSGELTTIELTTASGDTFDLGAANIAYER